MDRVMTASEVRIRQRILDRKLLQAQDAFAAAWADMAVRIISPFMVKLFAVHYEQDLYRRWADEARDQRIQKAFQ